MTERVDLSREAGREDAAVWLTDDTARARTLLERGACAVLVRAQADREAGFDSGISHCLEIPGEDAADWRAHVDADYLLRVWQRHAGLPWRICETERFVLRELTGADLEFLYELEAGADSVRLPIANDRTAAAEKLAAYREHMYGFFGFGLWLVSEKETGRPVGCAGLQLREEIGETELGYVIAAPFRGKGCATEVCEGICRWAAEELELTELVAVVDRRNVSSARVCEKLRFVVEKEIALGETACIIYRKLL